MADNLDITQGSGTTVATDQVGSAHYQKVKIVDGTADSSNPMLVDATGKLYVHSLTQGTVSISGATGTLGVYLSATAGTIRVGDIPGTIAVQFSPSEPTIKIKDTYKTSIISGTVSGSVTTVSTSGSQLVAPEANHATKIYAIAITTTAQVQTTVKLTNGSGASPVEYWRYALQAPTAGIAGANLAVTPPGYLFATAANTTLCLTCDNASLIHYSIGYFKESS